MKKSNSNNKGTEREVENVKNRNRKYMNISWSTSLLVDFSYFEAREHETLEV